MERLIDAYSIPGDRTGSIQLLKDRKSKCPQRVAPPLVNYFFVSLDLPPNRVVRDGGRADCQEDEASFAQPIGGTLA